MILKECGRKWSWPDLRYHLGICFKELRKSTSLEIVSILAKILTEYLLNTSQKGYHFSQFPHLIIILSSYVYPFCSNNEPDLRTQCRAKKLFLESDVNFFHIVLPFAQLKSIPWSIFKKLSQGIICSSWLQSHLSWLHSTVCSHSQVQPTSVYSAAGRCRLEAWWWAVITTDIPSGRDTCTSSVQSCWVL